MYVQGDKIKSLIVVYGKEKGYPEKSYVAMFCDDFNLNYNQWNAYTRGAQKVGTKIIQQLMEIFPNLNLNWLLKDDESKFVTEENTSIVADTKTKYGENITNLDLMMKLEEIHLTLKKSPLE